MGLIRASEADLTLGQGPESGGGGSLPLGLPEIDVDCQGAKIGIIFPSYGQIRRFNVWQNRAVKTKRTCIETWVKMGDMRPYSGIKS
jgi:hypothetical protein